MRFHERAPCAQIKKVPTTVAARTDLPPSDALSIVKKMKLGLDQNQRAIAMPAANNHAA